MQQTEVKIFFSINQSKIALTHRRGKYSVQKCLNYHDGLHFSFKKILLIVLSQTAITEKFGQAIDK